MSRDCYFAWGRVGGLFCSSLFIIAQSSHSQRERPWVRFRGSVPAVRCEEPGTAVGMDHGSEPSSIDSRSRTREQGVGTQ